MAEPNGERIDTAADDPDQPATREPAEPEDAALAEVQERAIADAGNARKRAGHGEEPSVPAPKKYPDERRQRAVRLYRDYLDPALAGQLLSLPSPARWRGRPGRLARFRNVIRASARSQRAVRRRRRRP
jgi:hypothetical protein